MPGFADRKTPRFGRARSGKDSSVWIPTEGHLVSFDEQRKAEVDAKMARAQEADAESPRDTDDAHGGIVDDAKATLRHVADRARDAIHDATERDR
jgi:hypothetical protein